jgi:hypothetical protein
MGIYFDFCAETEKFETKPVKEKPGKFTHFIFFNIQMYHILWSITNLLSVLL